MSVRARVQRLAANAPCAARNGTGIEPRDDGTGSLADRASRLADRLREFERPLVERARHTAPRRRTASDWSRIDPNTTGVEIVESILDDIADAGDSTLMTATRRYLAALDDET